MPDSPHIHDDVLLKLLKAGDERAAALLFDSYYEWLVTAVQPYVKDAETADDIVHELLWNVIKKHKTLRITRPVHRYLLKSAFNRVRNRFRDTSRALERLEIIITDPDELVSLEHQALDLPADSNLNVADINRLLDEAKSRMAVRVRLAFSLSRKRGLSNAQIADWMGII